MVVVVVVLKRNAIEKCQNVPHINVIIIGYGCRVSLRAVAGGSSGMVELSSAPPLFDTPVVQSFGCPVVDTLDEDHGGGRSVRVSILLDGTFKQKNAILSD